MSSLHSQNATSKRPMGKIEFMAMIAMLFATIAFSIDAMLPALPEIARELSPDAPNKAQLILTSFVLGMGIGTFITGPLSDMMGRKSVIVGGSVLYCLASVLAYFSDSLEWILFARVLQGLGAAAPRVVSIALIRDLYSGREMARIVSFSMMVFMIVPAAAPALGQVIITFFGWKMIFLSFIIFSAVSLSWFMLRQNETLPIEKRQPFRLAPLISAIGEVLSNHVVRLSIVAQTFAFAMLFATLSSTQPIFEISFGKGENFPYWFALIALISASASLINAKVVVQYGMRKVAMLSFAIQAVFSAFSVCAYGFEIWPASIIFSAYFLWTVSVFFIVGLTVGNLNAIALAPLGHIAGTAASVTAALATIASVILAVPVGLLFDGTPLYLMGAITIFGTAATFVVYKIPPTPTSNQP